MIDWLVLIVPVILWILWEVHRKEVNEAYRQGRRDGAEFGPKPLFSVNAVQEEERWKQQRIAEKETYEDREEKLDALDV